MTLLNAMTKPQSAAPEPPTGSRWTGGAGERLRYLQAGEGPPVVLIHGALSAAEDVHEALVDTLGEERTIYAFDRPGHGWSDRVRWSSASVQRQAEVLLGALGELGLRRPVLVGHSYGGSTALAMALAAPEAVAGVVAVSPAMFPEPRLEQLLFGARAAPGGGDLYARTGGRVTDPSVLAVLWEAMWTPQHMPDRFRATFPFERARSTACVIAYGEDAAAMPASLMQLLAAAPRCAVPVRVLVGSADVVTSNLHGRTMATAVPDGRFERLPGLGHCLHWSAPERVLEAVREIAPA